MNNEDKRWIDDAMDICKRAASTGVLVMLQTASLNDFDAGAVITNATDVQVIKALAFAISGETDDDEE